MVVASIDPSVVAAALLGKGVTPDDRAGQEMADIRRPENAG